MTTKIDRAELRRLCSEAIHHPDSVVRRERDQEIGQDAVTNILDLLDSLEAAEAREKRLREALRPFAFYAEQRSRKPFNGMDDVINGIHVGTEWEAEIRLSHCEAARAALAETAP